MIKIGVISILIIIPSLIFSTTKVGVTVGGDFVIDNGLIGLLQANLSNDQQNNINQMLSAGDNQSWMTNSYPSLQCWNLAFGITIWPEYETGWYYQYRLNYSSSFWKINYSILSLNYYEGDQLWQNDLIAGYEYHIDDNFSVDLGGGLSVNYLTLQETNNVIPPNNMNGILQPGPGLTEQACFIGGNIQIAANYDINPHNMFLWRLSLECDFKVLEEINLQNTWFIGSVGAYISLII